MRKTSKKANSSKGAKVGANHSFRRQVAKKIKQRFNTMASHKSEHDESHPKSGKSV